MMIIKLNYHCICYNYCKWLANYCTDQDYQWWSTNRCYWYISKVMIINNCTNNLIANYSYVYNDVKANDDVVIMQITIMIILMLIEWLKMIMLSILIIIITKTMIFKVIIKIMMTLKIIIVLLIMILIMICNRDNLNVNKTNSFLNFLI